MIVPASPRRAEPTFTLQEALRHKLADKNTFRITQPLWRLSVDLGSGDGVEPPTIATSRLVDHYRPEIFDLTERNCVKLADPILNRTEKRVEKLAVNRQVLQNRNPKLISPETEIQYSETEAVDHVKALDRKIMADEGHGLRHHRRVPGWLRIIAKYFPYLEAVGLAFLAATVMNVNFLDPLDNLIGWTLAVVIVVVVLFLQPRFVERSADAHNLQRQTTADHQSGAAEKAFKGMILNAIVAGVFAVAVTGALIERFLSTNTAEDPYVIVLMILLCTLAGIGMPLVDWIATAWDGSSQSRERDALAEQLNDGLAEYEGLKSAALLLSEQARSDSVTLREQIFPSIVEDADRVFDQARDAYAFLRLQIGGLPDAPPLTKRNLPATQESKWDLDSGIPGTGLIHLTAISNRNRHLAALHTRREEEVSAVLDLDPHPWATTVVWGELV